MCHASCLNVIRVFVHCSVMQYMVSCVMCNVMCVFVRCSVMQYMVSCIMCNDVLNPLRKVLHEQRKRKALTSHGRFRSVYRDLLFLALHVLGRDNIDVGTYYSQAVSFP